MTYIDARHKLFGHLDRLALWQQGQKPAPVTVEWDLSNRCALGCMDCHFAHTHTRGPWVLKDRRLPMAYDSGGDLADVAVVCRGLHQMRDAGVRAVVWTGGGEPTTHPVWTDIMSHAAALGLKQGMYTFGGLLNEGSAARLAAFAEWVVVSLDAETEHAYAREKGVHGFHKACNGIRFLAETGNTVVGVSFLLHRDNWFRAPAMLELARSLGATYTTFRPAIRTSPDAPAVCTDDRSWIDEQSMMLLAELARQKDVEADPERFMEYRDWAGHGYAACTAIRLNTTVTPDGRVWVCPQRRGCQNSCVGDLRTQSFGDLWATHVGQWTDFGECRVMCRLHLVNQAMDAIHAPRVHGEFI